MARNSFAKGKEITLRSNESQTLPYVPKHNKISIGALAIVLTDERFAYMVQKPTTAGGFGLTVFDQDDKIKTYLSKLDEPNEAAEELLDSLVGAQGIRLYRKIVAALEALELPELDDSPQTNTKTRGKGKSRLTDDPTAS